MPEQFVTISTTCDDRQCLERMAQTVIELRLAACAQLSGPLESIYHWQGKVETSQEWVCQFKTVANLTKEVESQIRKAHSYDEPEIIVVAIVDGSTSYLEWIAQSVNANS